MDPQKLSVALEVNNQKHIRLPDKHKISLWDGQKMGSWSVASPANYFAGTNRLPLIWTTTPSEHFLFIETQLLTLCDGIGDRPAQELQEIYSSLRRRPDGRSVSVVHDFLWRVVALLLGSCLLSEAEFEALTGALVQSTRTWSVAPIS